MKNLAIAIIGVLCVVSIASAQSVTVALNSESSVNTASITVGDLATVNGTDSYLIDAVKKIRLGVSPMPGSWRELDKQIVLTQLERNGYFNDRVRLVGPNFVRLYRQSQTVPESLLVSRLRQYIAENAPWSPDEMEILDITRTGDIVTSMGHQEILIEQRGGDFIGSTPFSVKIIINGEVVKQLVMHAKINVFSEAVVATNSIPSRNRVTSGDIEIRRVNLAEARGTFFSNLEDVLNMESTTYIRPGQILTTQQVRMPNLVKRGQGVALIAARKGFMISTSGVAMENGRKGDIIRVKNTGSNKIVDARVLEPGKAEVLF